MKQIKLYPPGGGVPVTPHPSKVEQMKAAGWAEKQLKRKPKTEVKEDGNS